MLFNFDFKGLKSPPLSFLSPQFIDNYLIFFICYQKGFWTIVDFFDNKISVYPFIPPH
jgi:hypothetical protein